MRVKITFIVLLSIVVIFAFCAGLVYFLKYEGKEEAWELKFQTNQVHVTMTTSQVLRYDYTELLDSSLLFFESMRSGELPSDNHVSWRGDSCLDCRGPSGEDLTGGYYHSGKRLDKSFHQISLAVTFIAWGLTDGYEDSYKKAGVLARVREEISWGADYLMKLRSNDTVVKLETRGEYWGRPEEATNASRFVKIVDKRNLYQESDTIFLTSAALAASSKVFNGTEPERARKYLEEAEKLYKLASNLMKNDSSLDFDLWATFWILIARGVNYNDTKMIEVFNEKTKKINYKLKESIDNMQVKFSLSVLNYFLLDNTLQPSICLEFFNDKNKFENAKIKRNDDKFHGFTSTIRLLDICLALGESLVFTKQETHNIYLKQVVENLNVMLGSAGRSFVTGWGHNPPQRAAHMASSCPDRSLPCSEEQKTSPSPNPQELPGALVYGPDMNGTYIDSREQHGNTVDIATNSAFQNVIAALFKIHMEERLPQEAYAHKISFKTDTFNLSIVP